MRPLAPGLPWGRLRLPWVLGAVAPVGLAMAWIPLRTHQSDVDVALLLVVVVAATGLFGARGPVGLGAIAAAVAFDTFDTAPYGTLAISRSQDLVTTVVLALVGASGGELGIRLVRSRRNPASRDGFSRVRKAAALVALGEEAVLVVGTVGNEISRLLNLRQCLFEAGDAPAGMAHISREGSVVTPAVGAGPTAGMSAGPAELALPVWSSGRPIGFFRLTPEASGRLPLDALTVAVTLADQVGAALSVFEAPGPGGSRPDDADPGSGKHLRLLR